MSENNGAPYRVGPGRPPLETRWKKGCRSPNPTGRPPIAQKKELFALLDPVAAMILEFDRKLRPWRTEEGTENISRGEAVMTKLYMNAITDKNPKALIHYQKLTRVAQDQEREYKLKMTKAAFAYQEQWLPAFETAAAIGRPLPNQFPDPRDIEIGNDLTVKIYGPQDMAGRRDQEKIVELRDDMISHIAKLRREDGEFLSPQEMTREIRRLKRRIAEFNKALPPRLRRVA